MNINPKKILIVKPSALGDIVHTLPILAVLKKNFPDAEIHWVVAKGFHEFLQMHPMIFKLWIIDKNKWKKLEAVKDSFAEIVQLKKDLKKEKFDVVLDLQGLLRTGLISKFTGSKCRIGFRKAREGAHIFYNKKVNVDWESIHAVERYLKILEPLDCKIDKVEFPMAPLPESCAIINELPEKYAVIAPSAGKEANRWPAERFGQLASKLDIPSVVVSSIKDADIVDEVISFSEGKAISVAGRTTIMELVSVIKKAKYFISNDTGPMHIAAALKVPVFAIFGPANPVRTGPYGDIHTIIKADVTCSPCYKKKRCERSDCLKALTVDLVYSKIKEKF